MASKRELQALVVLAGKIDPSLQKAMRSATKETKKFNMESSKIGKVVSKGFDIAKKAFATGAVAIGAAMLYVGHSGLQLASDLNEVQNVVDVTFQGNAKQIDAWSKTTLKSYGLSELAAKKYSGTIGAMLKSSGISGKNIVSMSENLTALSGDFASFYNLNPEDAFEKIRSGISGETEPLKQLGINMSVANLQAFALSKGIKTSWNKMDQGTQTMLRYNYLLKVSKDAQGDFTRTQGSFANQQRLFKESFNQLSATIMKAAIPAFTELYKKGNKLIDTFASDPKKISQLQNKIGSMVDNIVAFIPTAIKMASDFGSMLMYIFDKAVILFNFISANWSTIKPIIIGIVSAMIAWKAISIGMKVYSATMTIITGATNAVKFAVDLLRISKYKDAAATLYLQGLYVKDAIVKGASTAATWAWNAATKAARIGTLAAAAAQWALNSAVLANPITWIIVGIIAAIGLLVAGFIYVYKNWDKVSKFLSSSLETVKHAFAVGINFIVDKLNWLLKKINKLPGVNIPLIPKMDTGKAAKASSKHLKKYASGGFANRPSIFGEAGPEMSIPIKKTPRSLSLLSKTAQMLGVGTSGNGNPQFVYAPVINGDSSSLRSDLKESSDDFFEQAERWWESKRRESFA